MKKLILNNKTIFIGSAKFWRDFEEAVNRDIINEQTLGTKIEHKDYRVFQTEFGEIKIKDEKL